MPHHQRYTLTIHSCLLALVLQVVDKHLSILCQQHLETKFVRVRHSTVVCADPPTAHARTDPSVFVLLALCVYCAAQLHLLMPPPPLHTHTPHTHTDQCRKGAISDRKASCVDAADACPYQGRKGC